MMRDEVTANRFATYIGFFVCLWAGHLILRESAWQGSAELHALMEAIATLLALCVGIIALVRFSGKRTGLYLIIGTGFLGTGVLDGYHAVVASPWFADLFPAALSSLNPWSEIAPRLFLSVCLLLSVRAWDTEGKMREAGRISGRMIYLTAGFLTLASVALLVVFPLPQPYYPEFILHRPEELLPGFFFLMALFEYLHKGRWREGDFDHWLVRALILGFAGQAMFMSFSVQQFDGMFDAAHLLKNACYVFVLVGLVMNTHRLVRRAEKSCQELARVNEILNRESTARKRAHEALSKVREEVALRVQERSAALVQANVSLQREIDERQRAQEALERMHAEVESWVEQRTAELAQTNETLYREITERKRAESELEALHELSRQLDSTLELEDLFELALVKVRELLGVDLAVISIVDNRSGGLVLRAHPQVPHEQIQDMVRSEVGEWISGKAPEGWDPVLVDSVSEQHRLSSLATTLGGIESLICVPLKAKGTVVGHITFVSAQAGRFTEKGIPFLSSVASAIASAIDNARLYAQTKKDAEAKTLLFHELNHRVRNNLATIVGLLSMELGRRRRWTAEQALKACIDRVQSLAAIHDLLAQDEFRELDLKRLVEDVARAAVRGLSWEENVKIAVDAPPLRLPPKWLASLALAANELITNALRHAFRSRDAGLIHVQVTEEGGEIQLAVKDDGVGIPATSEGGRRAGVGLDIVASLVETDLRGQFQLQNDQGTVATIRFPKPRRAEG